MHQVREIGRFSVLAGPVFRSIGIFPSISQVSHLFLINNVRKITGYTFEIRHILCKGRKAVLYRLSASANDLHAGAHHDDFSAQHILLARILMRS